MEQRKPEEMKGRTKEKDIERRNVQWREKEGENRPPAVPEVTQRHDMFSRERQNERKGSQPYRK